MEEEVFEIIILELDYYLIERVRELRIRHKPYLSQLKLSQELELPESTVSKAENMKIRFKYNTRTLNKIANVFKLSYSELFPQHRITNDMVRMKLKKVPIKKRILKVNADGVVDNPYTILTITPLTEQELQLWQSNKLPYLTVIK